MARITVEDCLENVENRFELVMIAAKRARQIQTGGKDPMVPEDNDKPSVLALREIAEGLVDKSILLDTNNREDRTMHMEQPAEVEESSAEANEGSEESKEAAPRKEADISIEEAMDAVLVDEEETSQPDQEDEHPEQ